MATGIEGFDSEIALQRDVLADREPAYARLLDEIRIALADGLDVRLGECWAGRQFHAFYERPLLVLAALRYDALCEGESHPLHAAIAAKSPDPGAVTAAAVTASLAPQRDRVYEAVRQRFVQTNETTRAVTWMLPAHLLRGAGESRSLALVDLGTSAGLNLVADDLPAVWEEHGVGPLQVSPRLDVALRLGLDRSPLDVCRDDTAQWLRACVWPNDSDRLERLEAGIVRFRQCSLAGSAPRLEVCQLPDAPRRLAELPADALVLGSQTLVRDYMLPDDRDRYESAMRSYLVARPLAAIWAELELDSAGGSMERAAALTVHCADRQGDLRSFVLARTHPHPRNLAIDRAACDEFTGNFAGLGLTPGGQRSLE